MFKARPLVKFGKFLSDAGKKLIQENEENIELPDDNFNKIPSFDDPYDGIPTLERLIKEQENEENIELPYDNFNKIPSFDDPYDGNTTLERELNNLAKHYNRAKHFLENGLYDPIRLTFVESILIKHSQVTFNGGYYKNYVFKTYSKGEVFVLGPKDILIPGPNRTLISKDKNINPLKWTSLESVYPFMSIKCINPRACLRALAFQSEYFSNFISKEDKALLEKYICDLADKL